MISDALLREAAAEAEACLLANLPEVRPHKFSAGFERKMKRLISRANHPVRHRVLRYAAAVLLAILTLFGAVLAVSPEARAEVAGWTKTIYQEYIRYLSSNAAPQDKAAYRLTLIPDGYALVDVVETSNSTNCFYADTSGRLLCFSWQYSPENGTAGTFVYTEGYQRYSGFVHGAEADIYISDKENETSAIIWCDDETGAVLCIHAVADVDTFIALAESVKK